MFPGVDGLTTNKKIWPKCSQSEHCATMFYDFPKNSFRYVLDACLNRKMDVCLIISHRFSKLIYTIRKH